MAGKRIDMSSLADDEPLAEARVPSFAETSQRSARLDQVAANPLNTRDVHANRSKIAEIAESMRTHGQLQPCAVVTRSAFLAIFPQHEGAIGSASFVQVTGGRRRAAAEVADLQTLDITVKNGLAESRSLFLSATAAENIDREDLDPIEEAHAVKLLVDECGQGKIAAKQLSRTPAWVTQRLNLLKLSPEVQALLRSGEMALREARDLHAEPFDRQLAIWKQRREATGLTAVNPEEGTSVGAASSNGAAAPDSKIPGPRLSPAASAIRRLGETPLRIAESLRSAMPHEDLKQLVELLSKDL